MAAMGEVGDAQAKNIHTAEKFERSVRMRWLTELWCLEFLKQKSWGIFYLEESAHEGRKLSECPCRMSRFLL